MRPISYILDEEHRPVPLADNDIVSWGRWMQKNDRHVGYTELAGGIVNVSTVFLGIDHNHFGKGPPIYHGVWSEPWDGGMQWRYSSWDDAEAGHRATVKKVAALLAKTKVPEIKAKKKTE